MSTPAAGYRSYAGDDVVTGEGVEVELPVAGLLSRAAAGIIDLVVAGLLLLGGGIALGVLAGRSSEAVARAGIIVLLVTVAVLLPTFVEALTRGRTLGKLALGLRVVRDDGGPVTVRHTLTRALVGWLEVWMLVGSGAFIAGLVSPRVKRLGDMAAGTYVVSQRSRLRLLPPPGMPVGLEHWAASADVATLPAWLSVGIRQFLGRAGTLTPASRHQLGLRLFDQLRPYVSPAPPPGAHHEQVLAAVVAERRRRDGLRLEREDARRRRVVPPDPMA